MYTRKVMAFVAILLCCACGAQEEFTALEILEKHDLTWGDVGEVLTDAVEESDQVVSNTFSRALVEFVDDTLEGNEDEFVDKIYGLGQQEWIAIVCARGFFEGLLGYDSSCEDRVAQYYDSAFQDSVITDALFTNAIATLAMEATTSGDEFVARSVFEKLGTHGLRRREVQTVMAAVPVPRMGGNVSLADAFEKPEEISLLAPYVLDTTRYLQQIQTRPRPGTGMAMSRQVGARVGRRTAVTTISRAAGGITVVFWIADIVQTPRKRQLLLGEVRDTMLISGGQMQSQLLSSSLETLQSDVRRQVGARHARVGFLRFFAPVITMPELRTFFSRNAQAPGRAEEDCSAVCDQSPVR